jgi:uncharacterized protein YjbJ (UPF0337 family)
LPLPCQHAARARLRHVSIHLAGGEKWPPGFARRQSGHIDQRHPAASLDRGRAYNECVNRSTTKGAVMNWDRIAGNWKQMKGKVKEQWGKLTDDELDRIAGNRDQLVGKIQNSYGIAKDEAENQLRDWESRQSDVERGGQP